METHLKFAGILNAALGALGVLASMVVLILFKGPSGILLINSRFGGSATTTEGFVTACVVVYLLLMAGPLIVLYEIGILSARLFGRPPARPPAEEEVQADVPAGTAGRRVV